MSTRQAIIRSGHLLYLIFIFPSFLPLTTSAKVVSYIQTFGDKDVMIVDGKPFFYNGTQIPIHFFRHVDNPQWTWPNVDTLFKKCAADGFTVVTVNIFWQDLESSMNTWTWEDLDSSIAFSNKYGIKVEMVWAGSSTCGCACDGPASYVNGTRYQQVQNSLHQTAINGCGDAHMDLADTTLRAREAYVISKVMAHTDSLITAKKYGNVFIGFQVMNEPTVIMGDCANNPTPTDRSYNTMAQVKWNNGHYADSGASNVQKFNRDILFNYINALAKAVKTSNYSVWTRVNMCFLEEDIGWMVITKNETLRPNTYFDFLGDDPYTTDLTALFQEFSDPTKYCQGHNLSMVMENFGGADNTDQLIFTWNAPLRSR